MLISAMDRSISTVLSSKNIITCIQSLETGPKTKQTNNY